jgi:hypothetical protein
MDCTSNRTAARDLELVIARNKSALDWSVPYAHRRTIYNKGADEMAGSCRLPNVGGMEHTFLTHIIEHYADLAEYTVFLSCNLGRLSHVMVEDFVRKDVSFVADCLTTFCLHQGKALDGQGFLVHPEIQLTGRITPMRRAELPFSQWFDQVVGQGPHTGLRMNGLGPALLYSHRGHFGVRRSSIIEKPRSYYTGLRTWLEGHSNREEQQYIQYSWAYIFSSPNGKSYRVGSAFRDVGDVELADFTQAAQGEFPSDSEDWKQAS